MALLQPTDVPSRAGINNAITGEVDAHASTTDPNSQHYDSGWLDIPLRTGFQFSGEVPRYRRVGRQVFMRGRVARTDGTNHLANTQYTIGDLPAGFRPNPLTMWVLAGANGTQSGGRFWVTAAGEIIIQTQVATSNVSVAATFLNN